MQRAVLIATRIEVAIEAALLVFSTVSIAQLAIDVFEHEQEFLRASWIRRKLGASEWCVQELRVAWNSIRIACVQIFKPHRPLGEMPPFLLPFQ